MSEYLKIGQTVARGTKPANGSPDEREVGEVRGIQALEHPVSYLVKKPDETTEWVSESELEAIDEVAKEAEQSAAGAAEAQAEAAAEGTTDENPGAQAVA